LRASAAVRPREICFSVVTLWYALHGHAPDDVATHRTRARWYTTKTEPSYDDMAIKLRRVIIAARFGVHALSRPPRKKPGPSSQPGPPPGLDQQNCETREHLWGARSRAWVADQR
jgi:hypothetical protein